MIGTILVIVLILLLIGNPAPAPATWIAILEPDRAGIHLSPRRCHGVDDAKNAQATWP